MMTDTARQPDTAQQAARAYTSLGWRVMPVKHAGTKLVPSLYEWPTKATDNLTTVDTWWEGRYAGQQIGIVTGPESGIWVLDIDIKNTGQDGYASIAELITRHGPLPATPTATTRSGGRHYYFAWDTNNDIKNSASAFAPGLDVRGKGGYVNAPPTIHPEGGDYRWDEGLSPWDIDPQPAPPWLTQLCTTKSAKPTTKPKPVTTRDTNQESIADWVRNHYDYPQILETDGWTYSHGNNKDQYWVRPGKNPRDGHSAVLHNNEYLNVFSTSCELLQQHGRPWAGGEGVTLTLFDYLAATRHDGDQTANSKDLIEQRDTINNKPTHGFVLPAATPITGIFEDPEPDQWPTPTPLGTIKTETTPPNPFPLHAMPQWTQAAITDTANSIQVPLDMAGCVTLGALAVATCGRITTTIRPGHTEPANLWIVIAAEPLSGKSPTINQLLIDPISDERAALVETWTKLERQLKPQIDAANKEGDWLKTDALTRQLGPKPKLWTSNPTPEVLGKLLNEQQRGLAIVSDEGGPLTGLDRYKPDAKASTNLDYHLQGFSGSAMSIDRVSGSTEVRREHNNITMMLTVQPSVLRDTFANDSMATRGFLDRFCTVVPDDLVGTRDYINAAASDRGTINTYQHHIRTLVNHCITYRTQAADMRYTPEADDRYKQLQQTIENKRAHGGVMRHKDGTPNRTKLESFIARIAAILAFADNIEDLTKASVVTAAHLERAETLGVYFMSHQTALTTRLTRTEYTPEERCVQALAEAVENGRIETDTPLRRTQLRHTIRLLRDMTGREYDAVMALIADAGWVTVSKEKVEGMRSVSEVVRIHPGIVDYAKEMMV